MRHELDCPTRGGPFQQRWSLQVGSRRRGSFFRRLEQTLSCFFQVCGPVIYPQSGLGWRLRTSRIEVRKRGRLSKLFVLLRIWWLLECRTRRLRVITWTREALKRTRGMMKGGVNGLSSCQSRTRHCSTVNVFAASWPYHWRRLTRTQKPGSLVYFPDAPKLFARGPPPHPLHCHLSHHLGLWMTRCMCSSRSMPVMRGVRLEERHEIYGTRQEIIFRNVIKHLPTG